MNDAVSLPSVARLRWQCRRGMLELDLVLGAYLDTRYAQAPEAEKRRFVALLAVDDPTLNAWFFGRETPADPGVRALVVTVLESAVERGERA